MPKPFGDLAVVVPALNEADRIGHCLASLAGQHVPLRVFVSDNLSEDDTAAIARTFDPQLQLTVRTVSSRLGPSGHLVDTGRWGLAESAADYFAMLAGDDTWAPGFVESALALLKANPDVDVVYPTFSWEGTGPTRRLPSSSFRQGRPEIRKLKALLLPDHRELANLVYGVYRRAAFAELMSAWASGGDEFAADYAAAFTVVGRHRVLACAGAVSQRCIRGNADLLGRVGMAGAQTGGPLALATAYVRLNLRINSATARALDRAGVDGWTPRRWQVQLIRAPQWILAAGRHVRGSR